MHHVYAIPTNRLCANAMVDLSRELAQIATFPHSTIAMLVIDSSRSDLAAQNAGALARIRDRIGIETYHVRATELDKVMAAAAETTKSRTVTEILEQFTGRDSYGIAINRTLLAATALGANCIHRRDSDVTLQTGPKGIVSPLALEMRFLGRQVGGVLEAIQDGDLRLASGSNMQYSSMDPIYMVGGSYVGQMPVDYEALLPTDIGVMRRLLSLPITGRRAMTEAEATIHIERKFTKGTKIPYTFDEIAFPTQIASVGGNLSLFEIFRSLPVSAAEKTSAVDYFHHGMLRAFGLPYIHHNRSVVHTYTSERTDPRWEQDYYMGIAMGHCEAPYYNRLMAHVTLHRDDFSIRSGLEIAEQLLACLTDEVAAESDSVLSELIDAYRCSTVPKFQALAGTIATEKGMLLRKAKEDVKRHAQLIRAWSELIDYLQSRERNLRQAWSDQMHLHTS